MTLSHKCTACMHGEPHTWESAMQDGVLLDLVKHGQSHVIHRRGTDNAISMISV